MKIKTFLPLFIFLLFFSKLFAQYGSSLTITEVMFYPSETNGEFVEIYNTSLTETVDLTGFKIKYSTSSNNSLVAFSGGMKLAPNQYAVILQGLYDYTNGNYKNIVPAGTLILKTSTKNFGSSGMANSTDKEIYLINSSNATIDSYTYSANNAAGTSDEKILPTKNNTLNWSNSLVANGTPGFRNSVMPEDYDLSIKTLSVTPAIPSAEDSAMITVVVKNVGLLTSGNFSVSLFNDADNDSIGRIDENIFSETYFNLSKDDSIIIQKKIYIESAKTYWIIGTLDYSQDLNTANDKAYLKFSATEKPCSYNDIVINEVMYAPKRPEPEWVELYNKSDRRINIRGWKIGDNSSLTTFTENDFYLNPGSFLVISRDSSILNIHSISSPLIISSLPSLNDDGDAVRLKTSSNYLVDSLYYTAEWGGASEGRSLERISFDSPSIDQVNWGTSQSIFKSTPGKVNSVSQKDNDLEVLSFLSSALYAEANKPLTLTTKIRNNGNITASDYEMKLFADRNGDGIASETELISQQNGVSIISGTETSFDFIVNNIEPGVNKFIVQINFASDEFSENNSGNLDIIGVVFNEMRGDLVINEIMYGPTAPEPEWLEIYNKSSKTIDLKGYQIADDQAPVKIFDNSFIILPGEYVVVAKDSSIFSIHGELPKTIIRMFASLNNGGDRVQILDSLGRVIDSLSYSSSWGGSSGRSLERLDSWGLSTDQQNWKSSESPDKSTPCKQNSIVPRKYDLSLKGFTAKEAYVEIGNKLTTSIEIANLGKQNSGAFTLKIYRDSNHNLIPEVSELVTQKQITDLATSTVSAYDIEVNNFVAGQNTLLAVIDYSADEYVENNSMSLNITCVQFNEMRGDLVINEIMYGPTAPEPEWIEIYNKSSKTIDLKGYQIADDQAPVKIFDNSFIILPGEYVVVAKDSSIFSIHGQLPKTIIRMFASLNNSGDRVQILDSLGRVIDSLSYSSSWGGSSGRSLERLDSRGLSTDQQNWKSSESPDKSTPCKQNSIVPRKYDLSLKGFTAKEAYVEIGNKLTTSIEIANLGKQNSGAFTLKIYRDANHNLIPDVSELVAQKQITDLATSTVSTYDIEVNNFVAGQNTLLAVIDYSADEYVENNSMSLNITGVQVNEKRGDLVINEIMYTPDSSEPEWIEIYNVSNKTVEMKGYRITEDQSTAKVFYNLYYLLPGQFVVVAKDSSFFAAHGVLPNIIISSFGSLNNSGDKVMISDSLGRVIDSLSYSSSWGGVSGKSLERIDPLGQSTNQANWGSSISKSKSSPGKTNSLIPHNYDLSIKSFTTPESYVEIGKQFTLNVEIANLGKQTSEAFTINIYRDANNNLIAENSELVQQKQMSDLAVGSTSTYSLVTTNYVEGQNRFIAQINFLTDEVSENNSSSLEITGVKFNEQRGDLVINEIMYTPTSPEPEWIEIYNKSSKTVDLKGYRIVEDQSTAKVFNKTFMLLPDHFVVVAKDSNFFSVYGNITSVVIAPFGSFNNSGDRVMISDSLGRVIDSLSYSSNWGGTSAKSLERVNVAISSTDPTNWKTSQSKFRATPGMLNSVTPKNFDITIQGITTNVSHAVVGNEIVITTHIVNLGLSAAENYKIKLYKDINFDGLVSENELIGTSNGTKINSGSTAAFQFTTSVITAGANNFIAVINYLADEFTDNNSFSITLNGVVINENKGDLVINEFMYAPNSSEPEWLEIYNSSSKQINLLGYEISNRSTATKVFNESFVLSPDEYFVVAKDSSILTKYGAVPNLLITSFPSLSNTGDRIVLMDSLNRAIDSLEYKSNWGGTGGKSLERLEPTVSSTDSTNWKSCSSVNSGTPGIINSYSKKNFDISLNKIIFTPAEPLVGDKVNLKAEIYNAGLNDAICKVILTEILLDGSKVKLEDSGNLNLVAGNTLLHNFDFSIASLQSKRTFNAEVDFSPDQNPANNKLESSIQPGYPTNSIIVNEIMYNPSNGEPEWVEFYNNSIYDIDIYGWSITDVITTPAKIILKPGNSIIPANTYFVIVKDSTLGMFHNINPGKQIITTFANLNNDGDGVVIKDSHNATIDSVKFELSWGGSNGKSLERKSFTGLSLEKANWGSSKDIELSTPGRNNSLVQKKIDLVLKSVTTNPLMPSAGDNVTITAKVFNAGTVPAVNFIVKFYLISGSDTTFFNEGYGANLAVGDSTLISAPNMLTISGNKILWSKIIFDGDEEEGNNFYTLNIYPGVKRGTVLISEVMFDPFSGESEWVEIVNVSSDQINLKNWSISDLLPSQTKAVITTIDELLYPGEYAIISSDTAKFPYYPPQKFFQAKFGSLSTTDGVVLYDFRSAVIDSLKYSSSWGGSKGQSLERLSYTKSTSDSTNWFTSLNVHGATPGDSSSINSAPNYSSGNFVINEIMYDPVVGNSEYLEFYNTTNDSIQIGGMQIKVGSSSKVKLANSFLKIAPKEYFVLAADSSIYENYNWLKSSSNVVVANSSFSLSNEGVLLILKDLFSNTIDSLTYSSTWHNRNVLVTKNKSLERLNPSIASNDNKNWSTSVGTDGGSPGKANSILTQNLSRDSKVTISPNPFSPDNDGFEDFTIINLDLNKVLSQVRIKIYDTAGRLARTLENYMPSASKNSIIFDGLDDSGRPLRMGIYILLIETVGVEGGNVETIKTPIVVARKL